MDFNGFWIIFGSFWCLGKVENERKMLQNSLKYIKIHPNPLESYQNSFVMSTGASEPTWAPGRCTDGYEKCVFDRILMDFHGFCMIL